MSNLSDLNQDVSNAGNLNRDKMLESGATGYAITVVSNVLEVPESLIRRWIRRDPSLTDDKQKWLDEAIQDGQYFERIGIDHSIETKYDAVKRCTINGESVGAVCRRLRLPYTIVKEWVQGADQIQEQYAKACKNPQVGIQHHEVQSHSNRSSLTETDDELDVTDNMLSQDSSEPYSVEKEYVQDADQIQEQYAEACKNPQVGIQHDEVHSHSNRSSLTETDDELDVTDNLLSQDSSELYCVKKEYVQDVDEIKTNTPISVMTKSLQDNLGTF